MTVARRYGHFCPMARALELVGDRWTLLVVRDLLGRRRRFTELLDLCGGVTPRQLTIGLRRLEEAGVVARGREGRQVTYRLTPAGHELAPVIDDLLAWGLRNAMRAPETGEPVHAEHVLNGTRVALDRADHAPPGETTWTWRFPDRAHTLFCDGTLWTLVSGTDCDGAIAPDVVVDTTPRAWAEFVTTPVAQRSLGGQVTVEGEPGAVEVFRRMFMGA